MGGSGKRRTTSASVKPIAHIRHRSVGRPGNRLFQNEEERMPNEEDRYIKAQIKSLYADAEQHRAVAEELEAQAECLKADLRKKWADPTFERGR
jgi:hypothetical protein